MAKRARILGREDVAMDKSSHLEHIGVSNDARGHIQYLSSGRNLSKFPEEVVQRVLSHVPGVIIPRQRFIRNTKISPFRNYGRVSPAYILPVVCKQWFRLSTPLFYESVIIRSKAQAEALLRTLEAYPEFGKLVRGLRIEVPYGPALRKIIPMTPNVEDLFVNITAFPSDDAGGLAEVLPMLKPTTLILNNEMRWTGPPLSDGLDQLVVTLLRCLEQWTFLESVGIVPGGENDSRDKDIMRQIVMLLAKAPNLHTLYIGERYSLLFGHIHEIAMNPSLKYISCHALTGLRGWGARVLGLLRVAGKPISEMVRDEHQSLHPPVSGSAIRKFDDKIWARILYLALDKTRKADKLFKVGPRTQPSQMKHHNTQRLHIILLCKIFYRLGIQHLYSFPFIYSLAQLHSFAACTLNQPALIEHVKHILLFAPLNRWRYEEEPYDWKTRFVNIEEATSSIRELFGRLRLVSFGCYTQRSHFDDFEEKNLKPPAVPWTAFQALCKSSSNSLLKLYTTEFSPPPDAASLLSAFESLKNLRALSWENALVNVQSSHHVSLPPRTIFSKLRDLEFNSESGEPVLDSGLSLLDAMSHMDLPSLKTVCLGKGVVKHDISSFFSAHGRKILRLSMPFSVKLSPFDSCPNIHTLVCEVEGPAEQSFFRCNSTHTSLSKIIIDSEAISNHAANPDTYKMFPSLREIQVTHTRLWPDNEHDIDDEKNVWTEKAEELWRRGIKMSDERGVCWNPRLKRLSQGEGEK